jgi:hypothetical protein
MKRALLATTMVMAAATAWCAENALILESFETGIDNVFPG